MWAVLITIVMHIVLTQTRSGVYTIATGGNPTGAREAGVPANRIRLQNFVVASMLAGFAGIIEGIRIGSFDPGAAVAGAEGVRRRGGSRDRRDGAGGWVGHRDRVRSSEHSCWASSATVS